MNGQTLIIAGVAGGIGLWAYRSYRERKKREEAAAAAAAIAAQAQADPEKPWSEKTLAEKIEEEFGTGMKLARDFQDWITS
jgi:predicted negative regulator of RcsB-dependent stress response